MLTARAISSRSPDRLAGRFARGAPAAAAEAIGQPPGFAEARS
jgi:hypothetical protein